MRIQTRGDTMALEAPVSGEPAPLAGIRVLELASILAGPITGQFLA